MILFLKFEIFATKLVAIDIEGTVTESLPNAMFRVYSDNGWHVLTHISGNIRILPGDRLRVDLSPYDLTKGCTTYRLRNRQTNGT